MWGILARAIPEALSLRLFTLAGTSVFLSVKTPGMMRVVPSLDYSGFPSIIPL